MVHRLARPLLASMFVAGGVNSVQNPEDPAERATTVTSKVTDFLGVQADPVTLVRVNGAVQVGAGTLLALGKMRRLSALALASTLIPTTLAGHRFWEETDEAARAAQRIQFLKNTSMLGGLLLAATDTQGRPSLPWRARRVAKKATRRARRALPGH